MEEKIQHHGMKALDGLPKLCNAGIFRADRFGRMLPDAPPLYIDPQHLSAIGREDGPMKQQGSASKTNNIPVGHIFFGQFIDHDITLDLTSSFARLDRPEDTTNFRTPTLDLDCIYGDGPEGSPYLYFSGETEFNGAKLLTGADQPDAFPFAADDLLRSPHGRAVIGDPRNDENRVLSQLQLAMIRFHNKVCDHLAPHFPRNHLFENARRFVRWHYQWVVVNDFLRSLVGQPLLADLFGNGRRLYRPEHCKFNAHFGGSPFIPVEFSAAAYRFGHSMIPQRIQIQAGKAAVDVFGPTLGIGFRPVDSAKAVVEWPQLLDLDDATVDRADKLDIQMADDLLKLPFLDADDERSLATRNLLRGQAFRLPSGEYVARLCERPDDEIESVSNLARTTAAAANPPADLAAGTPLWLYLLAEASAIGQEISPGTFETGEGLGPVGGRLVAETLIGLLELDDSSYLGSNRNWYPEAEEHAIGVSSLIEMLSY